MIRARVAAEGGWIPFARYMDLALHAPGYGYYAAGAIKLGPAGDFVTAPEMTPLFGQALATQVAAILAVSARREIVELGAGSGTLAAALLESLARLDASPASYAILETSPDLRARQQALIARRAPEHLPRVTWLDDLPRSVDGVILANEVLDVIAVHVVVRRDGAWYERGVALTGDVDTPDVAGRASLGFQDRIPADPATARIAFARVPGDHDYMTEINPAAEALVEDLCRRLTAGAALFIDYGFPRAEYYHPQRVEGTLMCHYRHRAHADPLMWPGLTDITAHVDFTAMADAGRRAGLGVAGFAPQAAFLMGCGILDALAKVGAPTMRPYIEAAGAVQRLLSPAEMGELVKVLALARSEGIDWPGFALADRSGRL